MNSLATMERALISDFSAIIVTTVSISLMNFTVVNFQTV